MMDAKQVSCFTESIIYTMSMFLASDRECKKIKIEFLENLPPKANVHVLLGITGDLYGSAILSMNDETSLKIASTMMGMELTEHNDISYSAIKEILNISAGGASTRLHDIGKIVDLTPPTIITGQDLNIQMVSPLISVIFAIDNIEFRLSIGLQERKAKSILIVDDSELLRNSVANSLSQLGFSIAGYCKDGVECVEFLEREIPDLILLDIEMPRMNGIEVLQHIRDKKIPTKVVIFTSVGNNNMVKKATSIGVDGYMLKPINEALMTLLKNL